MARTKKIKEQEVLVDEDLVLEEEDDDLDLSDLDLEFDEEEDDDSDLELNDDLELDDEYSNVEEVEDDLDFDDEEDLKLDDEELNLDDDVEEEIEEVEEELNLDDEIEEVEEDINLDDEIEEVEEDINLDDEEDLKLEDEEEQLTLEETVEELEEEEVDFDDTVETTKTEEEVVKEEVKEEKPKRGRKKKEEVKVKEVKVKEVKEDEEIDMDEILDVEKSKTSIVKTAKDRKNEEVEEYVEEKVIKPTAKRVTAKELKQAISDCVDEQAYLNLFEDKVITKVRKYETITRARKEGKTDKVPTAKTVGRSDYASLMKAKLYSEEYYVTRFVRLLVSLGLDNEEAVNLVTKGKMSSIAFEELFFGLFTDTLEDVLKADSGVCLLQKENIRATLEGQFIDSRVQSLEHLIRSNKALKGAKYTHIRKGDYFKVVCKSKTSSSKLEKGVLDKNGNFVPLEEEK